MSWDIDGFRKMELVKIICCVWDFNDEFEVCYEIDKCVEWGGGGLCGVIVKFEGIVVKCEISGF